MNITNILQKGPKYLLELLKNKFNSIEKSDWSPEKAEWLLLAERSSINADREFNLGNNDVGFSWINVSTKIYEMLAKTSISKHQQINIETSAINNRVNAIYYAKNMSSMIDNELIDTNYIVNWFFTHVDQKIEEVSAKTINLNLLSKEELLKLRGIKNILNVIELLIETDSTLSRKSELKAWLSLKNYLP